MLQSIQPLPWAQYSGLIKACEAFVTVLRHAINDTK